MNGVINNHIETATSLTALYPNSRRLKSMLKQLNILRKSNFANHPEIDYTPILEAIELFFRTFEDNPVSKEIRVRIKLVEVKMAEIKSKIQDKKLAAEFPELHSIITGIN